MNFILLLLFLVFLFPSDTCAGDMVLSKSLTWHYLVVATPRFYGEPKTNSSQYRSPNPRSTSMPEKLSCPTEELVGTFEATIQLDGAVKDAHFYPPSGTGGGRIETTACQEKYVVPLINSWQFTPATYEGKPIEVIIRVFVEPKW